MLLSSFDLFVLLVFLSVAHASIVARLYFFEVSTDALKTPRFAVPTSPKTGQVLYDEHKLEISDLNQNIWDLWSSKLKKANVREGFSPARCDVAPPVDLAASTNPPRYLPRSFPVRHDIGHHHTWKMVTDLDEEWRARAKAPPLVSPTYLVLCVKVCGLKLLFVCLWFFFDYSMLCCRTAKAAGRRVVLSVRGCGGWNGAAHA